MFKGLSIYRDLYSSFDFACLSLQGETNRPGRSAAARSAAALAEPLLPRIRRAAEAIRLLCRFSRRRHRRSAADPVLGAAAPGRPGRGGFTGTRHQAGRSYRAAGADHPAPGDRHPGRVAGGGCVLVLPLPMRMAPGRVYAPDPGSPGSRRCAPVASGPRPGSFPETRPGDPPVLM